MSNYSFFFRSDMFFLDGVVIFDNVVEIYNCSLNYFDSFFVIKIDLSGVKIIDSSFFVLILSWIKKINLCNKEIYFYNVPFYIINFSKIYDFELIFQFYLK